MYRKDWIAKWADYLPDKVAVSEYEPPRAITYSELNLSGMAMAHLFCDKQNMKIGDRLMVLAEHGIDYVSLFVMAQKSGITLVPVNYRLTCSEINYLIQNSDPKILVAERKFEHLVQQLECPVRVIWMEDLAKEAQQLTPIAFDSRDFQEDHPLFILYTSGTTGFPKGAIYSHKMLLWNSLNITQSLDISAMDHTISSMPAFHTGGWNVLLTPFLHRGASVGILKKFDPDLLLKLMEREGSNLFMGVPTMLKMMLDCDQFDQVKLEKMRYFIVGGEALPLEVINRWHDKGIKIRQGYGLTEVGPNLTSLHHDDAERKKGSIGVPNFYVEIKLLDADGKFIDGEGTGELCISGPVVTPGYWNNPEATAKAIDDGWFRTGDIARMDAEGYLFIVDRIKNMYISGGENVYPAEVEKVLRNMAGVDEAAVVGVPDEKWGEAGRAYITLTGERALAEADVQAHCVRHLAKFKVPKTFVILQELPKNDSGKIDRKKLNTL